MAKTGIHIKRANVGSVEAHNLRTEQYLDGLKKAGRSIYFFQDQTHLNQSWVNPLYQGKTCEEIQKDLIELYKEKVGQSPQLKDRTRTNKKTGKEYTVAGWSPIREGVVPIKDSTTLDDFKLVKDWAKSKGLDVIRIDIHHDEGYRNEDTGETKHNRHAHIIFDWVDHGTGKTLKLDEKDMSEFQDIVAESLQMERGVAKAISGAEHIDHAEFRQRMAEQATKEMEEKSYQAEQDLKEAEAMKQLIEEVEIPAMKKEADKEISENKEKAEAALKKAIKDLEKEKADAEQSLKDVNEKITAKGEEIEAKNKELKTALGDLKKAREDKTTTEGDITELEQNKAEIEGDITKAKDKLKELDDNKDSLLSEIENLKGKEKELMKEGWSAFGWVAKRFIGIKDKKQEEALEEINKWRDEAIAEVNDRELKATKEIHKIKEEALDEIREETERNLLSEWKLKNFNIQASSKDEELGKTLIGLSSVNEGWKMIVDITKSALEWGIRGFQEIKNLINGQIVTLPRQKVVQGEVLGEEVDVRAVKCKDGIYRVANPIKDAWRFIDDFMKDLLERKARRTREEMEERAKEIRQIELEKPAAPQKPAPRFYGQKPSELQKKVDELDAPTPKKINVPKKGEAKKRGRGL